MRQNAWKRNELILAIKLYYSLPFSKISHKNSEIITLASLIGRTPSALAWKLSNFASFDPSLQARGIKGASNASNLDKEIWDEFFRNADVLAYESEVEMARLQKTTVDEIYLPENDELSFLDKGKTRDAIVKIRVNQAFFRQTVLASYDFTCCITGLKYAALLTASHIKPWSMDEKHRLNPRNGLCLSALHDRAFDRGLITITPDYTIQLSPKLKEYAVGKLWSDLFLNFEGKKITAPSRFLPDPALLEFHNREIFVR